MQAWARPHAEARESGLDLDLSRQPFVYPTQRAQTLIGHARSLGTQHSLAGALMKAYFNGRNINDADVLADIAAQHGIAEADATTLISDPAELAKTERIAARSLVEGIRSVPHFTFDGEFTLNGGRSEDELAEAVRRTTIAPVVRHSGAGAA